MEPTFLHLTAVTWTALQSIAAFLGLIGLSIYAFDTRHLRVAAVHQTRTMMRPLLVWGKTDRDIMTARNIGPGIATDFVWKFFNAEYKQPRPEGSTLAPQDFVQLTKDGADVLDNHAADGGGLVFTYKDLAGTSYWTKVKMTKELDGTVTCHITTGTEFAKATLRHRFRHAFDAFTDPYNF